MLKKIIAFALFVILVLSLQSCTINIPVLPSNDGSDSLIGRITSIIEDYSYYDITEEELAKMVVAAYSMQTGDQYAYYYSEEEYEEL